MHRPVPLACSAAALIVAIALPVAAQEAPALLFPVDCTLGETCFLQQFVDHDPSPGARAFDCGPQSYDGHTGTDIRTADLEAMAAGVAVIAAADGVVRGLRDGVPDGGTATMQDGQGCGNGVAVTHPGGWETQYCHLMEGSIFVREGQAVAAGAPLGLIGYSGQTEFPHLEFIVRHEGRVIDPFDAETADSCDAPPASLWAEPLANPGGGILSAGFAAAIPELADIAAGRADTGAIPARGEALVIWGFVHGGRAGDVVTLRIADAEGGQVHAQDVVLERTQAQLFRASGRRSPDGGWPPGIYQGEVVLLRDGTEIDRTATAVLVTP
ncbi:M23 family metallopeptidase [Roseicyclus marinus]|uniref:M23 family metallopeptidase n=1 Tax=Roseicyclus marinus TaxID=2161673 RepID=UPI00240EB816|nr:M23 family metallopeptidase [Roseicyclus marinus]MDG3042094.1 M23 family metallopeptidase [Roseicyclus marinus]